MRTSTETAARVWGYMSEFPFAPTYYPGTTGRTANMAKEIVVAILVFDPARGHSGFSGRDARFSDPTDDSRTLSAGIAHDMIARVLSRVRATGRRIYGRRQRAPRIVQRTSLRVLRERDIEGSRHRRQTLVQPKSRRAYLRVAVDEVSRVVGEARYRVDALRRRNRLRVRSGELGQLERAHVGRRIDQPGDVDPVGLPQQRAVYGVEVDDRPCERRVEPRPRPLREGDRGEARRDGEIDASSFVEADTLRRVTSPDAKSSSSAAICRSIAVPYPDGRGTATLLLPVENLPANTGSAISPRTSIVLTKRSVASGAMPVTSSGVTIQSVRHAGIATGMSPPATYGTSSW